MNSSLPAGGFLYQRFASSHRRSLARAVAQLSLVLAIAVFVFPSLVVAGAPVITIASSVQATNDQPFSFQIIATGQSDNYFATGLPNGLTIDRYTGLISGIPAANPGVYNVLVSVSDLALSLNNSSQTYLNITVANGGPPIISLASSSDVDFGQFTTLEFATVNEPTLCTATGLPPGFGVYSRGASQNAWMISGVSYGSIGAYNVTVSATNDHGTTTSTIILNLVGPEPEIFGNLSANAMIGQAFHWKVSANHNPTGYNATGLPPGLSISPSSGLISGTPTGSAGRYLVNLYAANSFGQSSPCTLELILDSQAAPVITSATTASVNVGENFSYSITASGAPTTYNAIGLPLGLRINRDTGVISGSVTGVSGTYFVDLVASNTVGTDIATLTLTVTSSAPVVTSTSSINVAVSSPLSYQISASNYPLSFNAVGLPPGTSIDRSTGLISGSPSATGTYLVQISAANTVGNSGWQTISIGVFQPGPPTFPPTQSGFIGNDIIVPLLSPFSYQIPAQGVVTSYNATGLPAGLTVNTTTGLISGAITQAPARFTFPHFFVNLTAANQYGTATASISITVFVATRAPVITNPSYASAVAGQTFSYQITADLPATQYNAIGLPPGLSVDETTGSIYGIPTSAGIWRVTLEATRADDYSSSPVNILLTVYPPASPEISSPLVDVAQVDLPYLYQIEASGAPNSFNATGVPPGIDVDQDTGMISGIPTEPGVYIVTLAVSNDYGADAQDLLLIVDE